MGLFMFLGDSPIDYQKETLANLICKGLFILCHILKIPLNGQRRVNKK